MTTQEKRKLAGWIVGAILLPLGVYGFKKFDAGKVDRAEFVIYVKQHEAERIQQYVRDSLAVADLRADVRYLICRQDFTRRECLAPR